MHMADALISPAVGGTLWVVSGGLIMFCARKVTQTLRDHITPLMGVLGAFIFAAQMVNFSIPGTGSSGHLGGGLLLAMLLEPYAAFLVIASVLTVQAFFFADGGLLALGCNIFNLGFFPAFIAYPFIYRVISRKSPTGTRNGFAVIFAAIVGLQLGAFGVVLETALSGVSELPFGTFLFMMLPIHLAIGIVEGLATFVVFSFVVRARPELVQKTSENGIGTFRHVVMGLILATFFVGGVVSWFASTYPDGLEWSIAQVAGKEERSEPDGRVHEEMAHLQAKTAILPDYKFKKTAAKTAPEKGMWPTVDAGTSLSGIIGGLLTLLVTGLLGFALTVRSKK